MPYSLAMLKIQDFAVWKSAFDEHVDVRRAAGEKEHQIFRSADDPNSITVLVEWDSLDNARIFLQSGELRDAMQKAGVLGQPEIHYLYAIEKASL